MVETAVFRAVEPASGWRRPALGLALALAAVCLALPLPLAPWNRHVREWFAGAGWPALPALTSLLLALAARCLPRFVASHPARVDWAGLAVGLLLLIEPLIHLGVLALSTWKLTTVSADVLLPPPAAAPSWTWHYALRLGTVALLAPVAEEYFFRGRLLPWVRDRLGAASAVSITTLAFAAAHGDVYQMLIALPLGVLLALMRLGGGGLGACIIAHAVHNLLFVIAGPALIAVPLVGAILAFAGLFLASFTWIYHLRPERRPRLRRLAAVIVVGGGLIAAGYPFYRALQNRLWVQATHRLVVYWRIGNDQLLERIELQRRAGRLDEQRSSALVELLQAKRCQTPERQTCLLAVLQPRLLERLALDDDDAYLWLGHLAAPGTGGASLSEAARRLAIKFPDAFAGVVFEEAQVVGRWFPLPAAADDALDLIIATDGFKNRRMLLSAFERQFPGRVADVLMKLPVDCITPADTRHLRANYPDLAARLAKLAQSDPERAEALGYERTKK